MLSSCDNSTLSMFGFNVSTFYIVRDGILSKSMNLVSCTSDTNQTVKLLF